MPIIWQLRDEAGIRRPFIKSIKIAPAKQPFSRDLCHDFNNLNNMLSTMGFPKTA